MKKRKILTALMAGAALCASMLFGGCGGSDSASTSGDDGKVVIYSNADDEAVDAMKKALDNNGFKDKYIMQTFGTSELGGKLMLEGKNIEADVVTMSTFYLDSAQEKNKMFADLTFDYKPLGEKVSFYAPITSQEGTIIVNTEKMKEANLPMPASLKDLANPIYKDQISVTDVKASSTAWLLIQGLVSSYGEEEAKQILAGIYKNAGPHIENSGSAPLKKVRAGEVAIGFGLRQQAVADKQEGLPIDYVDPAEGNFSLQEAAAVIDKGDKTKADAAKMVECIIKNGRADLLKSYPNPIYEGETSDSVFKSANPKTFAEKLSVDLLKKHQELSEAAKQIASGN
ncbi:extracellular solute-binding protein [Megamonas hypermegale]|uniref:extracellular solute-binding protein n=1 Tax=Megamonas hypermegale TaxID=158847 RepID=UPI0025A4AF0A|nr:extracellular solute-binding protein [Megamonas hypermegale]MDM8143868.1 extracellular solute-binding protein [Megamonas hypermegale]